MPISKIVSRSLQRYWGISRGLTLEARVALIDAHGGVLLVRDAQGAVWQLPGGRVKQRESVADTVARNLAAQVGLTIDRPADFFGIYVGTGTARANHTALFVSRNWRSAVPPAQTAGTWEHGAFTLDRLPPETCPATRQRILEIFEQAPRSETW